MLVDVTGAEIAPSDDAPSMERGAAMVAEMLTAGPDAIGEAFKAMTPERRTAVLADLFEFMQFQRAVWNALDVWNQRDIAEHQPQPEAN